MTASEELYSKILNFINGTKTYLKDFCGINTDQAILHLINRLESITLTLHQSIASMGQLFNNYSSETIKSILSSPTYTKQLISTLIALLFALNLTIIGVAGGRSTTIFPIAVFLVYLALSAADISIITSLSAFIQEHLPFKDSAPALVELMKEYDIPLVFISAIATYVVSGAYFVVKYIVFSYVAMLVWYKVVPVNPDGAFYIVFFLATVFLLIIYLKVVRLLELAANAVIFSVVGSLILIQFISIFETSSTSPKLLPFMKSIFSYSVDLSDRFTLAYISLALVCLMWQFRLVFKIWTNPK